MTAPRSRSTGWLCGGDYWVLGLADGTLKKLGSGSPESSLMFAKFSPDGSRVAYVRGNSIHVEHLADGRVTPITSDGSDTVINGTSDWVYEEELDLRDGFRWSPDGRAIAYWRFDASGRRDLLAHQRHRHALPRHYQERYMGLPQDNVDGYTRGFPINFAEGLKGKLLVIHGTGDDNVHYQGTGRLINRLVALGKPFDMMAYPNRTHSISEGPGTSVHVHQRIARHFLEHLAPRAR